MRTVKKTDNNSTIRNDENDIVLYVGRDSSNDIVINSGLVSSRHLKITKIGSEVFIEDLNSSNGTKIDGIHISANVPNSIHKNSRVLLADKERLDLQHHLIRPLLDGVTNSVGGGTINPNNNGETIIGGSNNPPAQPIGIIDPPYHDRFHLPYPYKLEVEQRCRSERGTVVIRVFSKESELRVIVFLEEGQEFIFGEEKFYIAELENLREGEEKRRFIKQEIENFIHTHKGRYCKEEIWHHVLTTDGVYKEGGFFKIVSEKSENRLKTKIYINGKYYKRGEHEEIERLEFEDSELIGVRAKEIHDELLKQYQKKEEELQFPLNIGWLNTILKRFPCYKKNPICSFWLFVVVVLFILWIAICASGSIMEPKINKKTTMARVYFGSIEEPLCGKLANKCIAYKEGGWLARETKKRCKNYCAYQVIGMDTCKNILGFCKGDNGCLPPSPLPTPYEIFPPNTTIGSTTTNGIILFKNHMSSEIIVELESIKVDNEEFPGIIVPISGKTKFVLEPKERGYRYDVMFESSVIGQLQKGLHNCKVTFKIKPINDENPHSKSIQFEIEI
jgi:hypothetical protein